jgi:hypothetical protein
MKDDMSTYEYKPEMLTHLNPGPGYPEKVFDRHGEAKHTRDTKFNLNSIRTSMLTQRSNKNRFDRGRLQAHLSLEKMRQDVQSI